MLVASQVLLSIVLPTVIFPLVYLCSKEGIMSVQGPEVEQALVIPPASGFDSSCTTAVTSPDMTSGAHHQTSRSTEISPHVPIPRVVNDGSSGGSVPSHVVAGATLTTAHEARSRTERKSKSYKSPTWLTVLGYFLFAVVVVANVYVIVELGMGNS